jgi:hypothetical protein
MSTFVAAHPLVGPTKLVYQELLSYTVLLPAVAHVSVLRHVADTCMHVNQHVC